MAKCVRRFTYIDSNVDTAQRYTGWQLENTPSFDPMAIAYGVTHDALEHHNAGEQGIENEMMAFGALYHIRVLGGWWTQFNTSFDPVRMVAWDMARFLSERQFEIQPCPKKPSRVLDAMLCRALEYFKEQLERYHGVGKDHTDYVKALHAFYSAGAWLSRGYTRSLKRWHGNTPVALCGMFNSITKKIEGVAYPKHGDTLEITFDTLNLNHSVYHTCNG